MPYGQKYTPPHCFFCNYSPFIIRSSELAVRQINDQMLLFERSFVANEDLADDDKTRYILIAFEGVKFFEILLLGIFRYCL